MDEQALQAEAAQSKGPGKKGAAADEDLDPTQYFENREKAIEARKAQGDNPYPHKFNTTSSLSEFVKKKDSLPQGTSKEDEVVSIGGVYALQKNVDVSQDEFFFLQKKTQVACAVDTQEECTLFGLLDKSFVFMTSEEMDVHCKP